MPVKIGLKYCGGCNPDYDRVALVEKLKNTLSGSVVFVSMDDNPGLVLVIQGCETACVDISDFDPHRIFSITRPDQDKKFVEWLKKIMFRRKNAFVEW